MQLAVIFKLPKMYHSSVVKVTRDFGTLLKCTLRHTLRNICEVNEFDILWLFDLSFSFMFSGEEAGMIWAYGLWFYKCFIKRGTKHWSDFGWLSLFFYFVSKCFYFIELWSSPFAFVLISCYGVRSTNSSLIDNFALWNKIIHRMFSLIGDNAAFTYCSHTALM